MHPSGKLLILGLLSVSLVVAGASWVFRLEATRRAAQFWGPEAATLIRDAPQVFAFRAREGNDSGAAIAWGESLRRYDLEVAAWQDVSQVGGLSHLRNALLEDRSFRWDQAEPNSAKDWDYGLCFRDSAEDRQCLVLFRDSFHSAGKLGDGAVDVIDTTPIAGGLATIYVDFLGDRSELDSDASN
jgi:hypothetical protein